MKKILPLIFLITAIALAGVIFVFQSRPHYPPQNGATNQRSSSTSTQTEDKPISLETFTFPKKTDTRNWQIIKSNDLGITFRIPQDWTIEGCGPGLDIYGIKTCEKGIAGIRIGRKKELRGEGEDFIFVLSVFENPTDLNQFVKNNLKNVGKSDEGHPNRKMLGLYQLPVDSQNGILALQRDDTIDYDIFSVGINYQNHGIWITGAEGGPEKFAPHGTFGAFVDSIRFSN